MWILISKILFTSSGTVSKFNPSGAVDYSKALWYDQNTGQTREATKPDGSPIVDIENYIQREQEGTVTSAPPPGNPNNPGPSISDGEVIREPRALTPAEIDEAVDNYYNNNNVPTPFGFFINEEGVAEEYPKDEDGEYVFPGMGPNDPPPAISPDEAIRSRLATQGIKQFLGFDVLGTPLGYQGAGEGYGDKPVYVSEFVTTLFMDDMLSEDYIRNLQTKLVKAGYLVGGFEVEEMDAQTQAAVLASMTEHNLEGRVPYFDDGFLIEGALLALQTTDIVVTVDGQSVSVPAILDPSTGQPLLQGDEVAQYQSQFAFTPQKKEQIRDFYFGELDNDISSLDEKLIDSYSIDTPVYDTETAGYIAMDAVSNYFGGADKLSYTQAQSLQGVVNKLLELTKNDFDKMIVKNVQEDIDATVSQINYDKFIADGGEEAYRNSLKELYPYMDPRAIDSMVRNKVASFKITTDAGLGPASWAGGTQDAFALSGMGDRFNSMFQSRLGRAVDKIYGDEKDLANNQEKYNTATANFFRSANSLRNLGSGI